MVILPSFYGFDANRFHGSSSSTWNRNLMMPLIDYIPGSVGEKHWKLYNFL